MSVFNNAKSLHSPTKRVSYILKLQLSGKNIPVLNTELCVTTGVYSKSQVKSNERHIVLGAQLESCKQVTSTFLWHQWQQLFLFITFHKIIPYYLKERNNIATATVHTKLALSTTGTKLTHTWCTTILGSQVSVWWSFLRPAVFKFV